MDKSVWLLNERGAPYAYRAATGQIVRVWNAHALVVWHKRRERANLPTVITSNIHPDDLEPRIADRVYGQTEAGQRIVWLPVYSYRRLRP